jgi:hypothetical protein
MFFGATAFAEAPFSSEGIINQSVEVTGVQAATNVDSVSILAGGSATVATGAEVDLESTVNTVEITADANINVSTNLLITALGNASIEAEGVCRFKYKLININYGQCFNINWTKC